MWDFVGIFVLGILLGFIFVWGAIKSFPFLGLLDFPERYNLKRPKLPYPGGLVYFLLAFGIFFLDANFWILIPFLLLLGGLSFWDDLSPLSAHFRLLSQVLVASGVYFVGVQIEFIGNPFAETNFELAQQFPVISFLLTVFWVLMLINALNWFDGISGLAVGVSGVGFLTLGVLGIIKPELFFDSTHTSLTLSNLYLGGLCLGGWYFFWKKKIILGDTGSVVLGFLLAMMSLFSGAKIATTLLVLGLPLIDFFWVIFRRVFVNRKSPFSGDEQHLHHLLSRKIGESKTSILLVFISSIFGVIALFVSGIEKIGALIILFCLILGLYVFAQKTCEK